MKYLAIIAIQVYWKLPNNLKNKCIHSESCSKYVYRKLKYDSFKKGLEAFKERTKTCNPFYRILEIGKDRILICRNGKILQNDQIAEWLHANIDQNNCKIP